MFVHPSLFVVGFLSSPAGLPQPYHCSPPSPCSAASGIPGGVFVHASGYIGGNDTLEGAVAMAAKALEME